METFNTTKTYTFSDLIRETSVMIGVVLVFYAVKLFWFPEKVTIFSIIFPGVLLLKDFYVNASRKRLQRLTFDTNNNEIVVLFKSFFSRVKQMRIPFDRTMLEVIEEHSTFRIFEPLTINIIHEWKEVFELSKRKDSVSIETLQEIVRTADQHAIRISSS